MDKPKSVKFTPPSKDELIFERRVMSIKLFELLILAVIVAVAVITKVYLALLALILLFNILIVFYVGRRAI